MKEQTYQLTIKFIEPILGAQSTRDVASEFISKRSGFGDLPEDEIETLPDALERGTTVFHKDRDGNPLLFNYQIKGFLKNAGKVSNGRLECDPKMRNLRQKIADYVFVDPRQIPIQLADGDDGDVYLERPLRAETAQGPRVALARSEMIEAGASVKCGLTVLGDVISEEMLRELLDYGFRQGIGQWRSANYGSFIYTLEAEK